MSLTTKLGALSWRDFSFDAYAKVLDGLLDEGERVYSAAYIMPSPAFGSPRKHRNHLRLIEHMMADGAPRKLAKSGSLRNAFELLRGYPSLGDFLAFQFAIDINYSELTDFSEMEFVVAGPGARDGISKYARVAHPEIEGESGRTRIKQKYTPRPAPLPQWYPPKWSLKIDVPAQPQAQGSTPNRRRTNAGEVANR